MTDFWPLVTKPYEVQQLAFNRGRGKQRYGYYLEQGLGKTAVDLADTKDALLSDSITANVVAAPAYLKSGWADEVDIHQVGLPCFVWPDTPTEKQEQDPFIQVMNNEAILDTAAVSRRGGRWLRDLMSRHKVKLTVDESVSVANFKSNVTNSVIQLGREAERLRLLSGLPTPENVMQWWSQLRLLGEINGINPYAFRNRYAVMGGYMNKKCVGYENEAELFEIVDRVAIRALKEDWLDLPPKVMMPPLEFELEGKQRDVYMQMLADFYAEVDDSNEVYAEQVIHQLMKLQQISRGFIKDGDTTHELVQFSKNPAIRLLLTVMKGLPGKTLVFAFHEYAVRSVFDALSAANYKPIVLRGGLKTDEIRERKAAFNRDPEVRAGVLQLTVGAKGHTMLGTEGLDRCSTSIFYENVFSNDTRKQAEDRNHRIGQDAESVNYFDLVEDLPGSPTRKAIRALQRKQDFVKATIDAIRTRRPVI